MPDLNDLLAAEAERQQPSHLPSFDTVVRRTRRRRRARAGALFVAAALAAGGVAAVAATLRDEPMASQVADDPAELPVANRTCRPRDLVLTLAWTSEPSGSLRGTLTATNPTDQACLLLVKPSVSPEGTDGQSLGTTNVVTMEGRWGPDALLPGRTAVATVTWGGWCGAAPGATATVSWSGEAPLAGARVTATGPTRPSCRPGRGDNLSSGWFEGLSARSPGDPVEVRGTLAMTGGPAGTEPEGVPGTVVLQAETGARTTATAAEDGSFQVAVVPGWYRVSGTSPLYEGTCLVDRPLYVPVDGIADVEVACPRK